MINIRPFGSYILVQPTVKSEVLMGDTGTLCEYGKVLALGEGAKAVTSFKVGDEIGFLVWGIQKLAVEDETFYFVPVTGDFILGWVER